MHAAGIHGRVALSKLARCFIYDSFSLTVGSGESIAISASSTAHLHLGDLAPAEYYKRERGEGEWLQCCEKLLLCQEVIKLKITSRCPQQHILFGALILLADSRVLVTRRVSRSRDMISWRLEQIAGSSGDADASIIIWSARSSRLPRWSERYLRGVRSASAGERRVGTGRGTSPRASHSWIPGTSRRALRVSFASPGPSARADLHEPALLCRQDVAIMRTPWTLLLERRLTSSLQN